MNARWVARIVLGVFIFLLVANLPIVGHYQSTQAEEYGTITIYNESKKEIWISIRDTNYGSVWPRYSQTFTVPLGEFKCTAEWDDGKTSTWFHLTPTYSHDEWTINQNDVE